MAKAPVFTAISFYGHVRSGLLKTWSSPTLFQNSDDTTRRISLPQHLVKPLHTSRCTIQAVRSADISCNMNPVIGPRGFPTELTPRSTPCCIVRIFLRVYIWLHKSSIKSFKLQNYILECLLLYYIILWP